MNLASGPGSAGRLASRTFALHDLRHNYASYAVMQGIPVTVVSRLLGHSSVRMTLRYVHLGDREVRAAAERIGEAMAKLMDSTNA